MKETRRFAGWLDDTNEVTRTFLAASQIPDLINLAGGLPEPDTWPVDELSEMSARLIRDYPSETLAYGPIEGLPGLRDEIARRFSTEHVTLTHNNILITTGGMQGLDLIGKILLEKGDLVACQSPAYLGALDAWRPRQPVYRPMFLERPGFDPGAALQGTQFAYTVPNFSNPSGYLVPEASREALVEAAMSVGTWLVEDDPYGALYYDGQPLARMLSLVSRGHQSEYAGPVIYLGTLSKELAPGLRIGWTIAAPEIIAAMTIAKQGSDMCTSTIGQRMAQEAMSTGLLDRVLPSILEVYRKRRDVLCQAMDEHLGAFFEWSVPQGGMFVWARARSDLIDTDELFRMALEYGVCVSPSSVFDPEARDRSSIRINFTYNPSERLAEGVVRLAQATKSLLTK